MDGSSHFWYLRKGINCSRFAEGFYSVLAIQPNAGALLLDGSD